MLNSTDISKVLVLRYTNVSKKIFYIPPINAAHCDIDHLPFGTAKLIFAEQLNCLYVVEIILNEHKSPQIFFFFICYINLLLLSKNRRKKMSTLSSCHKFAMITMIDKSYFIIIVIHVHTWQTLVYLICFRMMRECLCVYVCVCASYFGHTTKQKNAKKVILFYLCCCEWGFLSDWINPFTISKIIIYSSIDGF